MSLFAGFDPLKIEENMGDFQTSFAKGAIRALRQRVMQVVEPLRLFLDAALGMAAKQTIGRLPEGVGSVFPLAAGQ